MREDVREDIRKQRRTLPNALVPLLLQVVHLLLPGEGGDEDEKDNEMEGDYSTRFLLQNWLQQRRNLVRQEQDIRNPNRVEEEEEEVKINGKRFRRVRSPTHHHQYRLTPPHLLQELTSETQVLPMFDHHIILIQVEYIV